MTEVKVLIEGYAKELPGGWRASSSTTLIKSRGKNIIVDPGCNRAALFQALAKAGLATGDIGYVLLTHSHIDHVQLAGMFDRAKVGTPDELYTGDRQGSLEEGALGPEIEVIKTPGHCPEHWSFIVRTDAETWAIAGDVFWWTDAEKQKVDIKKADEAHPDDVDMKALIASRKKLLELADIIVPGHGKPFRTGRKP